MSLFDFHYTARKYPTNMALPIDGDTGEVFGQLAAPTENRSA